VIAVELRKLFRRPRTWATIAVLNALPVLVAVLLVLTDLAPRPGEGPPFLSAVLRNGALYPLAALAIVLPLFLPIAVAVVAGDSIAGEASAGTLRYLLARPAGRTRLLVAKLIAVLAFVLVTVLIVAGVGYVLGTTLFDAQPVTGTSVSGTSLTPADLGGRTLMAIGYVAVSMLGVAAFALFFSTLTDSPLGATMGALDALLAVVRRLLPRPDPLARHHPRDRAAGRLRRRAAGRGMGELHDEGHHELRPAQSASPSSTGGPGASSASTISWTRGSLGSCPCPTCASAHTDWTGRFTAPSSRAESGGVTVWSRAVQIDTHVGPSGVSSRALRRAISSLSGSIC
jgi:ABC-2 type transport system permease protein